MGLFPARQTATNLKTIVSPATKFEYASLLIEGKIFDVDLARRFVDRRRFPFDQTLVVDGRFGCQCHFEVTIGARKIS